jgi:uncharacterized membrane protein
MEQMTGYAAAAQSARVSGFSLTTEIALPWRLMAIGVVLFGAADIVAGQGAVGAATSMFFGSYGVIAAAFTLLLSRKGR